MSATLLLDEFPLVARAPNGIGRIRELIHHFALSGGLSERRNRDSSAAAIVEDSLKKKEEYLATSGTRRGSRKNAALIDVVRSHPSHWEVTDAGDLLDLINGRAFKSNEWSTSGKPIIRIQNLNDRNAPFNYFQGEAEERHHIRNGDMLLSWSGTPGTSFGAFIWDRGEAVLNQHIFKVAIFSELLDKRYLQLAINACLDVLIGSARGGVGLKHVTKGQIEAMQIPLPPLEEQKRIVAKADELMGLCDRLESQLAERAKLLPLLSQANHARFVEEPTEENLKAIFHEVGSLSAEHLRMAIISLGISGHLVPQDKREGTGQQFVDSITKEKQKLIDSGVVSASRRLPPIEHEQLPFDLPDNWCWTRLESACEVITKGSSPKWQGVSYVSDPESGVLFITSENVGENELRKMESPKYVERKFNEMETRSILCKNDILLTLVGASIGRAALWDRDDIANINQAVGIIRLVRSKPIHREFLLYYLNSPTCIAIMFSNQVETARANISLTNVKEFLIPVPPLSEQVRIAGRISKLLALVDQLHRFQEESRDVAASFAAATCSSLSGSQIGEDGIMKPPKTLLISELSLTNGLSAIPDGSLAAALATRNSPASAKELWSSSGLEIDEFYRQLKAEIANGWIAEPEPATVKEVEAD